MRDLLLLPARHCFALQEKQSEISELQTRLAAAADKNVALTEANASLDARLHEAQAAASRAALTQTRLEQEKEIMEKSNAWLSQARRCAGPGCCCGRRGTSCCACCRTATACQLGSAAAHLTPIRRPWAAPFMQELERKGEAFNAERRKATDTILDLQRRLAEAESTAQRLQARCGCWLQGVALIVTAAHSCCRLPAGLSVCS